MKRRLAPLSIMLLVVPLVALMSSFVWAQQVPVELRGTWDGQSSTTRGAVREFKPGEVRLVFSAERLNAKGLVAVEERHVAFSIDPKATPKQFDYWEAATPNRKFTAIYKIEGDVLTIAVPRGEGRPTEFAAEGGAMVLLILKRHTQ